MVGFAVGDGVGVATATMGAGDEPPPPEQEIRAALAATNPREASDLVMQRFYRFGLDL
jgi:hypothetical protein